jgi:hypothetical protein
MWYMWESFRNVGMWGVWKCVGFENLSCLVTLKSVSMFVTLLEKYLESCIS